MAESRVAFDLQIPADDGQFVYLEMPVGHLIVGPLGVGVVAEGGDHLTRRLVGPHRRSSH